VGDYSSNIILGENHKLLNLNRGGRGFALMLCHSIRARVNSFCQGEGRGLNFSQFVLHNLCMVGQVHRFPIEVACSLVIKHNSKLNGVQTIQISQVFLALLSSSEPSFEYSIAEE
jgi:hypothetical protein